MVDGRRGRATARPMRAHPHLANMNLIYCSQVYLRREAFGQAFLNSNSRSCVARTARRAIPYLGCSTIRGALQPVYCDRTGTAAKSRTSQPG